MERESENLCLTAYGAFGEMGFALKNKKHMLCKSLSLSPRLLTFINLQKFHTHITLSHRRPNVGPALLSICIHFATVDSPRCGC